MGFARPGHALSTERLIVVIEPGRSCLQSPDSSVVRPVPGGAVPSALDVVDALAMILNEVRSGVYEGDYTIRTRDRLTATSLVTARIVRDGREMNATLDQSLVRGAPSPVQAARIGGPAQERPIHAHHRVNVRQVLGSATQRVVEVALGLGAT